MTRDDLRRCALNRRDRLQEQEAVEFHVSDFSLDPEESIRLVRRLADAVQNEMAAIIHPSADLIVNCSGMKRLLCCSEIDRSAA